MTMTQFSYAAKPGTIYFIGAGPGAPDLITVRGRDLIAQADLILYADSLVEESVAELARKSIARIEGSSGLHLEQILDLMVETAQAGGVVARIHSGDPTLYGAIHEQMAYLEDYRIPYEIVPGVTAAFAAAAQLKIELTVPDLVQTIILTRTAGRTTMPAGEDLRTLAAPGASLAIYLSISRIRQVVEDLLASGGYGPDTPVAVHHKVTWPDESCVTGTLADIVEKVKQAGYTKHALILISPVLDPNLKGADRRTSSHLYDKSYTHRFRRAEDFKRGKERREAKEAAPGVVIGEKHFGAGAARQGCVTIAITHAGSRLAARLAAELEAQAIIPDKHIAALTQQNIQDGQLRKSPPPKIVAYATSVLAEVRRCWASHSQLILIMPAGVAVRAIAPLLGHKSTDPAVICLDEAGQTVIPLLGGHQAGANALARHIAKITGGQAAITTASDIQGKPALDLPPGLPVPGEQGSTEMAWRIDSTSALTYASACLVDDEPLGVYIDPELTQVVRRQTLAWLGQLENLTVVDSLDSLDLDAYTAGLIVTHRRLSNHHQHLLRKSVLYRPPVLVAGIGCQRDVPTSELRTALETTLAEANLALDSVAVLATADLKASEPGLQQLAAELNLSLRIIERARIAAIPHSVSMTFSPSAAQEKFGLLGVAEPCARLATGPGGRLIVPKCVVGRCTVAIALMSAEAQLSGIVIEDET